MHQDIRFAWRFLRKAPVSTAVAVVTLGVTVAICSLATGLLDETLWRPLALDGGSRLITIYNHRPAAPQFQVLSYPDYADVRDRLRGTADVAAFVRVFQTLAGGDSPVRVQGELVSGNYFDVLSIRPYVGRLIAPKDEALPIVVLGYDFWRRTFSGDPGVIGRIVRLNREDYTVAGVTPPGFRAAAYPSEFWIPLGMSRRIFGRDDLLSRADVPMLQTIARPTGDPTATQLDARVQALETSGSRDGWRLSAWPASYLRFWPAYRATVARFVGIFAVLGVCVLLIACANLAALLLARASERRRELSLRLALGATRGQLVRRLVSESAILGALGAAVGVWLAYGAAPFVTTVPVPVPAQVGLTPGLHLVAVSLVVSLAASFLFTAAFVLRGVRADIRSILASSSATVTGRSSFQRLLVVTQVAISCVCLTTAGLLVRSARAVDRVDAGFDLDRIVMGQVVLGDQRYTPAAGAAFYERLQEELAAQPGVESVALEWNATLGAVRSTSRFSVGAKDPIEARYNIVSPGYFDTLRIPILAGRAFDRRDSLDGEPVVLVNQTMAARIGNNVVGTIMTMGSEREGRRIVGVVREAKYNGITEPAQPFVYFPLAQSFRSNVWLHVRGVTPQPERLLRDRIHRLDPDVAITDVHTLSDQMDASRAPSRTSARVAAGLGTIAISLALIGIYGLLAGSVEQRRRELSIRAALGASPGRILSSVAITAIGLTAGGLALGTLAAFAAGDLLNGFLYGVTARDPLVFGTTPLVIFAVSTLAWLVPASRAANADPIETLRAE